MTHVNSILMVCLMALGLVACGPGNNDPEWLFAQSAAGGGYADATLTLYSVTQTVAFTDRPDRSVQHIDNANFARAWEAGRGGFATASPNAALTYESNGGTGQLVVELTGIRVTADSVVYDVRIIEGDPPAADFGFATLFIDGCTRPPDGPVGMPCMGGP